MITSVVKGNDLYIVIKVILKDVRIYGVVIYITCHSILIRVGCYSDNVSALITKGLLQMFIVFSKLLGILSLAIFLNLRG